MADFVRNPGELLHSIDLIDARSGDVVNGGDVLRGKVAAVAIGPHWLPSHLSQTLSSLSEHLDELKDQGEPVEFVYVTVDRDEKFISDLKQQGNLSMLDESPDLDCFNSLIKELGPGWLVVPFEDAESRAKLLSLREGFFGFAFLGENGETFTTDGLNLVYKWGADGFPYTSQRIVELEKLEEERVANQTLKSLLVTPERDFVVENDGTEVKVEGFQGKVVGLYFSGSWSEPCVRFIPQLDDLYFKLKLDETLEVVFISEDKDETSFQKHHREMPWLAIPFSDTKHRKLLGRWFGVKSIPALVFLDEHSKIISTDGVDLVYNYALDGFPFTTSRLSELKAIEDGKRAEQSIETLLSRNDHDYLISRDGFKVEVSELIGKTVGLYFSAQWCAPCRSFTPLLVEVYNKLNREEFEVVFISSDRDIDEYSDHFGSSMPWPVVQFQDRATKCQLASYFQVEAIPTLVIIGPDGKTVTRDGRSLITTYREQGFPYTEEHIRGLEEATKEMKNSEEHPLLLVDDPPPSHFRSSLLPDSAAFPWY